MDWIGPWWQTMTSIPLGVERFRKVRVVQGAATQLGFTNHALGGLRELHVHFAAPPKHKELWCCTCAHGNPSFIPSTLASSSHLHSAKICI